MQISLSIVLNKCSKIGDFLQCVYYIVDRMIFRREQVQQDLHFFDIEIINIYKIIFVNVNFHQIKDR